MVHVRLLTALLVLTTTLTAWAEPPKAVPAPAPQPGVQVIADPGWTSESCSRTRFCRATSSW